MFFCIIKEIYEECKNKGYSEKESKEMACYSSADILRNFSKEKIEKYFLWDCSGPDSLITDEKIISYVSEQERFYSKTRIYYYVRSFFRLKKGDKVSYKYNQDKHKMAQYILGALIMEEHDIIFEYRKLKLHLKDIELIREEKVVNHFLEKQHIEKEIGINRIADLLFELQIPNQTFGKGIVFEIVNTENKKSIEEKSHDWAKIGYSLITIPINNFDFERGGLKKDTYQVLYRLFDDIDIYLKVLDKIKENEPLLDNFNKNIRDMERRQFLWRNGKHMYQYKDGEKIKDKILLFCFDIEEKNQRYVLKCYDYTNKFIDVIKWTKGISFDDKERGWPYYCCFVGKIITISNSAYFKLFKNEINIHLNQYSKIDTINLGDKY